MIKCNDRVDLDDSTASEFLPSNEETLSARWSVSWVIVNWSVNLFDWLLESALYKTSCLDMQLKCDIESCKTSSYNEKWLSWFDSWSDCEQSHWN